MKTKAQIEHCGADECPYCKSNNQRVENLLKAAGGMEEQARFTGEKVSRGDEIFVREAKKMGEEIGWTSEKIQFYLEEGAKIVRRAMPI